MLKRLLIAVPLAVAATLGLFLAMRAATDIAPEPFEVRQAPMVETRHRVRELPPPPPPPRPVDSCDIDCGFSPPPWPSPVIRPAPPYPACGEGEGEVVLEFPVEADGSPGDIEVVSATSPCFAEAARFAARQWRYRPRVVEGKPVRSERIRVKVVYVQE